MNDETVRYALPWANPCGNRCPGIQGRPNHADRPDLYGSPGNDATIVYVPGAASTKSDSRNLSFVMVALMPPSVLAPAPDQCAVKISQAAFCRRWLNIPRT